MEKIKNRFLIVLITMLVFTVGLTVTAAAAPTPVKVTAYEGIKIIYNGQEVSGSNQPYIINNVTYVPFRLLMENFGKNVSWDAANYKVLITDDTISADQKIQLSNQVVDLQNKNKELQNTITSLNAKIAALEANNNDTSTSDIAGEISDYLEDAGDDYFDDAGIDFTYSLSGDEDELVYKIVMDLDDADDYDDLTEISSSDIASYLNAVKSRISLEANDTDYDDADITGKLIDANKSSYYVQYNGSSYAYSWDDDGDISDIEESVVDYFADAGDDYFDDDAIEVDISLDGDEDEIEYDVAIDCSDSDSDYTDMRDISTSELKTFLNALKSRINSEIDDTDFADADISGYVYDRNHSSYNIKYDSGSYSFSW